MTTVHGQCLCGDVEFAINGPLRDVLNCHCHRCRRWTGHHMAATAADPLDITFASDATVRWYSPDDGGCEYGFCATCGSSLFWRVVERANSVSICAGVLDPPTGLRTIEAWWVSEASDYATRQPGLIEHLTE